MTAQHADYVSHSEAETMNKLCAVHGDAAGPKDSRCRYWWLANGGDPKAGLATPCKFVDASRRSDVGGWA